MYSTLHLTSSSFQCHLPSALVSWAPLGPLKASIQDSVLEELPILRRHLGTGEPPTWGGLEVARGRLWQPGSPLAGAVPGTGSETMSRDFLKQGVE